MKPAGACLGAFLFAALAVGQAAVPQAAMPRVDDYTQMWWAEGFPSHTPTAPWLRCVQTGSYAMAFNTETLRVPHFGAVAGGQGYDAAVQGDDRVWQSLPAADLALDITVDGKAYRCTAGGKWSRFKGPRVIESGRFFSAGGCDRLGVHRGGWGALECRGAL